jgi:hypothetical protein
MVSSDSYRIGVTVFRCKWFENAEGPGYRVASQGERIDPPRPLGDGPVRKRPARRRELEVILDFDAVTPSMIADWCDRAFIRRPMIRLLVSGHHLESERKRGLALQFKHPLDARAFVFDFRPFVSGERW